MNRLLSLTSTYVSPIKFGLVLDQTIFPMKTFYRDLFNHPWSNILYRFFYGSSFLKYILRILENIRFLSLIKSDPWTTPFEPIHCVRIG